MSELKFKVSLIVPVYNRADELRMTLDSVMRQTLPKSEFEVVIADDGSAEDMKAVLSDYPELHFTYCRQEDRGFRVAAVRNLGIGSARGEIIVFDDNGILLAPEALETHVRYHEGKNNLLVLGYMFGTDWKADTEKVRALLEENPLPEAIKAMKEQGGMGDGREGYMARFGRDLSKWYIPWLGMWGGHFSVRRDFIDAHGIRFDENFTSWGGEDNDFGIQMTDAGAEYVLAGDIEVVHYPTPNRANSDIKSEEFKAHYREVTRYIAEKHNKEEVILWRAMGSSVNDPQKRAEYIREHGIK